VIYEVNTAIWLADLSRAAGHPVTLADVPGAAWDSVTPPGVDAVWLMGVWQRSPAGLELANANQELQASFRAALPDVRPGDVIGSPYCVRRYAVDDAFGGPEALVRARAALAERGVRLVLDYVPNHVAPDHPWVSGNPELFINGAESDLQAEPDAWLRADGNVLAHGRDPYFPPWPDVVQLNAFSPALRAATSQTLADIAAQCDGIRCDMAMLMTNLVFSKTWGGRAGREPDEEFWPAVISGLHARHPETVLIAEAYWDMEWTLQQQGFDYCYDKRLYDRLLGGDATGRPRLPVSPRPLPGKSRRAACREPAAGGRGTRRGCRDRDASRCHVVARGTVRGPPRASAGLPVAQAAGNGRPGAGRLVPRPARRRGQLPGPSGHLAAARGRRLAGQRLVPQPAGVVLGGG
jgi:hypothetical protein